MNYLKNYYGDLKLIVNGNDLGTDFKELKKPVSFLDSIRNIG